MRAVWVRILTPNLINLMHAVWGRIYTLNLMDLMHAEWVRIHTLNLINLIHAEWVRIHTPNLLNLIHAEWVMVCTLNLINQMHAERTTTTKTVSRGFKEVLKLKIFSALITVIHHMENQGNLNSIGEITTNGVCIRFSRGTELLEHILKETLLGWLTQYSQNSSSMASYQRGWIPGSGSACQVGCLNSSNLVQKAWKIPGKMLILRSQLEEGGFIHH